MKLLNGFEKTIYWTIEEVRAHAEKFSKTYKKGPWQTDFDAMAKKTVLKNGLTKWGILSVEMQKAIETDQATVNKEVANLDDLSHEDLSYPDNPLDDENVVDTEFTEDKDSEIEENNMFDGTPFEDK